MSNTENQHSATLLRMVLPRMGKHQVPTTPHNYAVWYRYLEGSDAKLTKHMDALIEAGASFTGKLNEELYNTFVSECNLPHMSRIRDNMRDIIGDVSESLTQAGDRADSYGGTLDRFARDIDAGSDTASLHRKIQELIRETAKMSHSTQQLRSDFDDKNAEIEELKAQLSKAREEACTDPLTGMANRQALYDAIEVISDDPAPSDALLILDIDHFKQFNDNYGHLVGDKVIRFVASTIKRQAHGQAIAARYGGEEFVLVLPEHTLQQATNVAEHIRRTVEEAKLVRSDTKEPLSQITLSCGIARYRPSEDASDWLERADQALYHAKKHGRNQVVHESMLGTPNSKAG